MYKVIQKSLL